MMRAKGFGWTARLTVWLGLAMGLMLAGSAEAKMTDWEARMWAQRDVLGKMDLVVKMYYDGRAADAADSIRKLLGEGLADAELVKTVDRLTPQLRGQMVNDPATADAVKALIEAVEKSVAKLRTDQAYIDSVVAQLKPSDEKNWEAVQRCLQLGEYAVPAMVSKLDGTNEPGQQVLIGKTLTLMGPRAVRPLSEAIWLSNPAVVVQVCDTLGEIRNELALGALSEVLGDKDRTDQVRLSAAAALAKVQGSGHCKVTEQGSASAYYYVLGDAYLHGAAFTLPTMDGKILPVWSWSAEDKKIVGHEVSAELYAPTMAERCCSVGLRLDKDNTPLRGLLVSSLLAEKLAQGDKPSEVTENNLKMAILAGGEPALYASLGKALAEGDPDLAIAACQTLGNVTTGKGIPLEHRSAATNPLLGSLTNAYRPVRLAAAQAIVAQAPAQAQGPFEDVNMVLPALSWGLMHDMPAKYVLVASPTDAVVAAYRGLLTGAGYRVATVLTAEAMLAKAAELPKPDFVIMDATMVDSLRQLRMVLMDPGVHVLLIGADDASIKDLAAKHAARGVIAVLGTNPGDKELATALALAPKPQEEAKLLSAQIPNVSQQSAETLAAINAQTAPYRMSEVVPALREALAYEQDGIRVPALKALGSIGSVDAMADVLKVAVKADNSKPVRLAALNALGAIFEGSGEVSPDVFGQLVPLTDSDDKELSFAAAKAVTVAKFNPDQFADLVLKKRVEAIKAGAKD